MGGAGAGCAAGPVDGGGADRHADVCGSVAGRVRFAVQHRGVHHWGLRHVGVRRSPSTVAGVTAGLADDAQGLAAQLVAAERTIRDPAASPGAVAEAGRRQQLAYRRFGAHPDWEPVVTARRSRPSCEPRSTSNLAATTIRRRLAEQAAAAAITAPSTDPTVVASTDPQPSEPAPPVTAPTLPAWTIRAPKPAAELLGYYREAEAATGVPWPYLAAINLMETRMGRIVGVSTAGAEGPMQFLPTTWAACCQGDVWNDHDAIMGAATYLAMSGAPGDMAAALWQYNPNEVYVEMVTRYAAVMAADERAYLGYHAWEVFYGTAAGDVRLPEGYIAAEPDRRRRLPRRQSPGPGLNATAPARATRPRVSPP